MCQTYASHVLGRTEKWQLKVFKHGPNMFHTREICFGNASPEDVSDMFQYVADTCRTSSEKVLGTADGRVGHVSGMCQP